MTTNNAKDFLISIAKLYGVQISGKWQADLEKKISDKMPVLKAKNTTQWIHRGRIPLDVIDEILKCDSSDKIKTLCENYKNLTPEGAKRPRGTTILTGRIEPYGENNSEAEKDGLSLQEQVEILKENRELKHEIGELRGFISKHRPKNGERRTGWDIIQRVLKIIPA